MIKHDPYQIFPRSWTKTTFPSRKFTSTIRLRTRWTCSQGCFSTIQANHIHLRFSTGGYAGRCHVRETSKMPREPRAKKPCWRMPELSFGRATFKWHWWYFFGFFSVVCWRWVKMTRSGSNICEYPFMSSYHIVTYHIETIYLVDNLYRAFHNSVLTQWYILQHLVTLAQLTGPSV